MNNNSETIFIDGQLVNLDNLTSEKIQDFLNKLNEKLISVRKRRDDSAVQGKTEDVALHMTEEKDISSQIMTLISKKFEIETSKKMESIVDDKKQVIEVLAKSYGVDPQIAEEALNGYANSLGEVRTAYKDGQTAAVVAYSQMHEDELKAAVALALKMNMAKGEVNLEEVNGLQCTPEELEAASLENVNNASVRTDSLREYVSSYADKCSISLDEISRDEVGIVKVEKEGNFITNFFKMCTNRINGKEKFKKNVVEPLENKNKGIKKVIPFIKKMIKEELAQKLVEVCLLKKGAPIRAAVLEKITTLMPMIENGAVTVASVLATSAAAQAITIAGLAAGAAIIAKVIYDKVKNKNDIQEIESEESSLLKISEEIGEIDDVEK